MIKDLHKLFNSQNFNDYIREADSDLPLGLKILETQGEEISDNEVKIQNWLSCYGQKMAEFPTIDETNTKVTSKPDEDSSCIIYSLPFKGDHTFFFIKPNGPSHRLKCTINELNKSLLIYYPLTKNMPENEQKAEISEKYKSFVADLKESLASLKTDFEVFNDKVETAIRNTIESVTEKAGNNRTLVEDLQNEVNSG